VDLAVKFKFKKNKSVRQLIHSDVMALFEYIILDLFNELIYLNITVLNILKS